MSVYQIAGFNICLEDVPASILRRCEAYRIGDVPKDAIALHINGKELCITQPDNAASNGETFSRTNLLFLEIYREICTYALAHDAFLMHCAVIEYEGRGYAFSAPSGTGKTTHIRLWRQVFGKDKVTIVNGDKPILRVFDDAVYAYGTPWCGKEGYNVNTRVPLCGLCFVERGKTNKIRPMSTEEAVPRLFGQIMVDDSPDLARQMELADQLLEKVPCYLLSCNMEPEAARVAYDGMNHAEIRGGADA